MRASADRGEIGALGDGRTSLLRRFPAEADAIVMPVDRPGTAEAVTREALLDGLDHRVNGGGALTCHQQSR
jgi:hypothetical protein